MNKLFIAILVSLSGISNAELNLQHESLGNIFSKSAIRQDMNKPVVKRGRHKKSHAKYPETKVETKQETRSVLPVLGGAAVGAVAGGVMVGSMGYGAQKLSHHLGWNVISHDAFRVWFRRLGDIRLGCYGLALGVAAGAAVGVNYALKK